MGPNDTLRLLDEARRDFDDACLGTDREAAIDAIDRVQRHAGDLHHWLNRSGFLPWPTMQEDR